MKPLRLSGWLVFSEGQHVDKIEPKILWKHPGLAWEKHHQTRAQPVIITARGRPVSDAPADPRPELTSSQRRVLEVFQLYGPMTDERLVALVERMTPSGARSRRAELVLLGKLRDSGQRHMLATGGTGRVWERVTP